LPEIESNTTNFERRSKFLLVFLFSFFKWIQPNIAMSPDKSTQCSNLPCPLRKKDHIPNGCAAIEFRSSCSHGFNA
jgi:hypothetical protein